MNDYRLLNFIGFIKRYYRLFVFIVMSSVIVSMAWQYWSELQLNHIRAASKIYYQVASNDQLSIDEKESQLRTLIQRYPQSIYSAFAHMQIAKFDADRNKPEQAIENLNNAIRKIKDANLTVTLKLRIAQLQLDFSPNESINIIQDIFEHCSEPMKLYAYWILIDAYALTKQYSVAEETLEKAFSLLKSSQNLDQASLAYYNNIFNFLKSKLAQPK